MIQLELQEKFRDDVNLYYERQEKAFENLSDEELEEMGVLPGKAGPAHQNLAFASTLSKYSGSNAQASRLFLSPRLFDFS